MVFFRRVRMIAAAASFLAAAGIAAAQDVSDSHLAAARKTVDALNATDQFDVILPAAAAQLKADLIQKNPDMDGLIIETVDEQTLALVSRRADLEREVALAYARIFSEEELNAMAEFYASPAGQKLLEDGPIVAREVQGAAEIWQRGIARDLAQAVGEELDTIYQARQGAAASGDGSGVPLVGGEAAINQ